MTIQEAEMEIKRLQEFIEQSKKEDLIEKQKAYMKIIRYIAEKNQGWKPDWGDSTICKFYIAYNHSGKDFYVANCLYLQEMPTLLFYESEQIAEQACIDLKEEYLIYFGIK